MKVINMKMVLKFIVANLMMGCLLLNNSFAQNVIYLQDFEDPLAMDWILNDPIDFLGTSQSDVNFFQVNNSYVGGVINGILIPDTDDQILTIDNFPNSNYLHVTSFQAQANLITNTNYLDAFYSAPPFLVVNQELIGVQTPDISTVGYTGVELDFHWLSGVSTTGFGAQLFYSTNFGLNWTEIGVFRSDSIWYNEITNLNNAIDDLPNVRFAFVFNNNLGENVVGFALDDFKVTAECEIDLGEDYFVCSGETTNIQANNSLFDTYLWNSAGQVTDNIDVVVNTDTTIIISASNAECPNTRDTLEIFVQFERPVVSLSVLSEINGIGIQCFGDSSGAINLQVIGGTANPDSSYNVSWLDSNLDPIPLSNIENTFSSSFNSTFNNAYQGEFFVQVTDAVCNVPIQESVEIFSNPEIENSFSVENVNCFQGSDGQIVANPSSGVAPYSFSWGFSNEQTVTGLSSGTYSVVITDTLGCSKPFTAEITQPGKLLVDASIYKEISCLDSTNGILTAVAYGGTPDVNNEYYFVWSHPNFDWVDNVEYHNDTIMNLPPSVTANDALDPNYQLFTYPYLLTVTDANGCEATSEIYLVEPQELEVFVSQDIYPAYCTNSILGQNTGFAQVSAQGGTPNDNNNYNFVWSIDNQTDEDVLFSSIENVNAGAYSVTVVDDRLCADTISFEVGLETTWQSFTSTTPTSCYGDNDGSVSIQMEGGCGDVDNSCEFTYLWQGGSSTGNVLQNVSGLQQGNYSVIVSDEWGCQATYSLVIDGPSPIEYQVTSLVDQSCYSTLGSSSDGTVDVNINGGTAPYNVFWTDENSVQNGPIQTSDMTQITGFLDGTWEVEVYDVNNCVGNFDISSLHPNPFIIDAGKQVAVQINSNELLLTDTIRCFADQTGSAIVLNADPLFTYSWYTTSDPNTVINQGLSSDLLPAGDIFVEASYNLGLCKENSNPVTIEQMPAFSIVENHVAPSCYGESDAIINVVVNGGSPFLNNVQISDYNFEWFPLSLNGQGVNQTNGQLVFSIPNMGSGSHFLKVVDRYGCDTVFNVVVPETEPLSANIDLNNLSCNIINEPNTDGELQVNVVGGTFPYVNFMLIQANDTLSINNTGLFENLESGTYSISFEDIRGCGFMENNIILSQPPVMDIDIQSFSNVLCNGENTAEIQVSSTGGTQPYVNFSISGTSVSSSSGLFEDLGVGVYTILVEDQNGCNDSVSQTINEPSELLEPTFNVTDVSCFNDFDGQILTDVFGGTPPYLFSWSNGENEEDIDKLFSGNYTVTITDDNGCQQSGTTFVDQPDQVIADWLINTPIDMSTQLIMSQPIPYTVSFTDTSLNHDPLLTEWWIDGENRTNEFYGFDQYVDFTFREIGEYDITMYAYNMNGCFDTISTNVTVQGISHINAFSPNSDNINDFFYFENYGITDLNAVLYNRWGDKIYEMDSPDDVWNGVSLNGLEAPEGVYFYVLNATGQDGTDYKQKGSVTLFK